MIIKYISNPLEPKDTRYDVEVKYTYQSMDDYFNEVFSDKLDDKEYIIPITSGKVVDWDYIPSQNDEIIFVLDVTGGKFLGAILGVALIVIGTYTGQGWMVGMGVSMIAGTVVGMLMPGMSMPTTDSFEDSPTYKWDGIHNWVKEGSPVPILYGEHRIGGAVIEAFVEKVGQDEYLYMLLGISEGPIEEIDTTTIEINKKNIQYYENIDTYTRLGTVSQTPIQEFAKIARYYKISNKRLQYGSPYIYQTYNDCNSAKITISSPALFHMTNKGNFENKSVNILVEYKETSSQTWTTHGTETITSKSKSAFYHSFDIGFPANASYQVRFTRQEEEYTGSYDNGETYLYSVTEYELGSVAYTNTALLGLKIKATYQISGSLPTVTVKAKGRLIKDVKTGLTGSTASNNPADIINDLITNERYALGTVLDSTNIHTAGMIEYYDNNNELVNYTEYDSSVGNYVSKSEKRYEVNLYIDKEFRALDIINRIATATRMIPVWVGNKFKPILDVETEITQLFTMGNIKEDTFEQTFNEPQSIPNQVKGKFLDEEDNYKTTYIPGIDKSRINETPNAKTIELYGLTKRSRVKREVVYALKTLKAIKQGVSFETGLDAVVAEVGDVIGFSHAIPGYGTSGRLDGVAGNYITLDEDVSFTSGLQYAVRIVHTDNTITRHTWTASTTESTNFINIGTDAAACSTYDIYAIGKLDVEVKPYRIMSITKKEDYTCKISGVEYNSTVYNEDESIQIEEINYSNLGVVGTYTGDGEGNSTSTNDDDDNYTTGTPDDIPPYVTDVNLTESIQPTGSGYLSNITVHFGKVFMQHNSISVIDHYDILYSTDTHRTWVKAGESDDGSFVLPNITIGTTYWFVVKPYTNYGKTNNIEVTTYNDNWSITPIGWDEPPEPATNLTVTADLFINKLTWTKSTTTDDLKQYEIWASFNVNNLSNASIVGIEEKTSNHHAHYISQTGTWYYWVRAVDYGNNYSTYEPISATGGIEANPSVDNSVIIDGLNEAISESELTTALLTKVNNGDNTPVFTAINNQYTVKIQDDDYITGFGLINYPVWSSSTAYVIDDQVKAPDGKYYKCILGNTNVQPPNGTYWSEMINGVKSEFIVLADRFAVVNQTNTGDIISPFVVDPTQGVVLDGVVVKDGSISADQISVNTLSSLTASLGTITAGLMKSSDDKFKVDLNNKQITIDDNAHVRFDGTGQLIVGNNNIKIDGVTNDIIVTQDGGINGHDYTRISPTDGLEVVYYMNGAHRHNNPLTRIESGTCYHGQDVNIPGYWKEPPKIILSLKDGTIYDSTYNANDQTLQLEATNITQYSPGKYRFTPKATLNVGIVQHTISQPDWTYIHADWQGLNPNLDTYLITSPSITPGYTFTRIEVLSPKVKFQDYVKRTEITHWEDGGESPDLVHDYWEYEYNCCDLQYSLELSYSGVSSVYSPVYTLYNQTAPNGPTFGEPGEYILPPIVMEDFTARNWTIKLLYWWTHSASSTVELYHRNIVDQVGFLYNWSGCSLGGDIKINPAIPTVINSGAAINYLAIGK